MNLWRILILGAVLSYTSIYAFFEYNNVKCIVRDPTFMEFEYCYLRSVNRTYKYFSVKTRFFTLPIDNAAVNLKVMKRDSKHVLDHYNVTIDACKFLKYRSNALANILFSIFEEYSNLNHTCPYNHDLYVEKLPVAHVNSLVKYIIPNGRYFLNTSWSMSKIPRAEVVVYFTKY